MKTLMNVGFRHMVYAVVLLQVLIFQSLIPAKSFAQKQITVRGVVSDLTTGTTLPGAHVVTTITQQKTVTDADGHFRLAFGKPGPVGFTVSFLGYTTITRQIVISRDTLLEFRLDGAPILGEEVNIVATRARDKYPTAFSSVTSEDIKAINLGKDIPYLIQQTPSVVVTSDAGTGIGYSGLNIRGTDLTRINVTVNGIPINDAESQGVWFVDLPDLASSTADIQIQRGVGTSTNGAGAFGASINFMTSDLQQDPYGELSLSGGSFNTFKSTLKFGTGLMKSKISIDGRLSLIHSDGYIDRATADLKSWYFSGGYFGSSTTLKFITFSGFERTYQAWNGVPRDSLATNRTYNPAGEYTDRDGNLAYYKDQVDNYQQDHYQLIFSQKLAKRLTMNTAFHYTHGNGYYENYKEDESFGEYGLPDINLGDTVITHTNLVNRKMMDNHFYGLTFSGVWSISDRINFILGGAWNRYDGDHFGKVIWAEYASTGDNDRNWYSNTGVKKDFNVYGKVTWQWVKWLSLFADLQYRRVDYTMMGTLDNLRTLDQKHHFDFFNPKGGISMSFPGNHELFASFSIANREPSRNNYKDADPDKMPVNETLYDLEAGYSLKKSRFNLAANLYWMQYKDQLVLTGEINNVGEAVMVNVPRSYRLGVELSGGILLIPGMLDLSFTATVSRNKIKNFIQYIDQYDEDWNFTGQQANDLGTTNLSFSPSLLGSGSLIFKPLKDMKLTWNSKYVGEQFIDNTSSDNRKLSDYLIHGITADYTVKTKVFSEIGFQVTVSNLFSRKYETNAWVYPWLVGTTYNEVNGYFPQALINFLAGITLKI